MGKHTETKTNKNKHWTQLILAVSLVVIAFFCGNVIFNRSKAPEVPVPTQEPVPTAVIEPPQPTEQPKPLFNELIISEVMTFNRWFPKPPPKYMIVEPEYYDWIELRNISDHDIELSDYYLSDNASKLQKYNIPEGTLKSGEYYVVYCDDDCFSLGDDETVYLSDKKGNLHDVMDASNIKYSYSAGRIGKVDSVVYFETPTPGKKNGKGLIEQSEMPELDGKDGAFNDVESVEVKLKDGKNVYYTTDGSYPTSESEKYKGSIKVTETSVLRFARIEKGMIPSETLDLSYIINENHTLPVTSVVMDPGDFNGKKTGIYNHTDKNWEKVCSVRFIDGDDGFYIKSGIKLHGATSRLTQDKKSYTFKFRDVYDGNLHYDLFGNGVTKFSSVIMRSSQEAHISTEIRDILFHELAQQCYSGLSTQDYRFTILYINGQYWGIYAYREQHSEEHYAAHTSYKKSDITMYEEEWPHGSEFEEIEAFANSHDLSDDANYQYVADHIDIDALIAWILIEGYSGNMDVQPHNVKFYYTESDQTLHYALLDLDLGGFVQSTLPIETGYKYGYLINNLMQNKQFKSLLFERADEYLKGPLSDENVFALKASLADEIRDEIPRDAATWQYKISDWEGDVREILEINTGSGTAAKNFAKTIKVLGHISTEEYNKYFADIK